MSDTGVAVDPDLVIRPGELIAVIVVSILIIILIIIQIALLIYIFCRDTCKELCSCCRTRDQKDSRQVIIASLYKETRAERGSLRSDEETLIRQESYTSEESEKPTVENINEFRPVLIVNGDLNKKDKDGEVKGDEDKGGKVKGDKDEGDKDGLKKTQLDENNDDKVLKGDPEATAQILESYLTLPDDPSPKVREGPQDTDPKGKGIKEDVNKDLDSVIGAITPVSEEEKEARVKDISDTGPKGKELEMGRGQAPKEGTHGSETGPSDELGQANEEHHGEPGVGVGKDNMGSTDASLSGISSGDEVPLIKGSRETDGRGKSHRPVIPRSESKLPSNLPRFSLPPRGVVGGWTDGLGGSSGQLKNKEGQEDADQGYSDSRKLSSEDSGDVSQGSESRVLLGRDPKGGKRERVKRGDHGGGHACRKGGRQKEDFRAENDIGKDDGSDPKANSGSSGSYLGKGGGRNGGTLHHQAGPGGSKQDPDRYGGRGKGDNRDLSADPHGSVHSGGKDKGKRGRSKSDNTQGDPGGSGRPNRSGAVLQSSQRGGKAKSGTENKSDDPTTDQSGFVDRSMPLTKDDPSASTHKVGKPDKYKNTSKDPKDANKLGKTAAGVKTVTGNEGDSGIDDFAHCYDSDMSLRTFDDDMSSIDDDPFKYWPDKVGRYRGMDQWDSDDASRILDDLNFEDAEFDRHNRLINMRPRASSEHRPSSAPDGVSGQTTSKDKRIRGNKPHSVKGNAQQGSIKEQNTRGRASTQMRDGTILLGRGLPADAVIDVEGNNLTDDQRGKTRGTDKKRGAAMSKGNEIALHDGRPDRLQGGRRQQSSTSGETGKGVDRIEKKQKKTRTLRQSYRNRLTSSRIAQGTLEDSDAEPSREEETTSRRRRRGTRRERNVNSWDAYLEYSYQYDLLSPLALIFLESDEDYR